MEVAGFSAEAYPPLIPMRRFHLITGIGLNPRITSGVPRASVFGFQRGLCRQSGEGK